jgi:primosomal protein N' (replication factor Y)
LLPPYGRLAAIVISARDKALVEVAAREISRRAPSSETISILGPAEAPIAVVRGRHRWRLLVKAPREADLQGYLRAWAAAIPKLKSDVRITVDVDPYNFL